MKYFINRNKLLYNVYMLEDGTVIKVEIQFYDFAYKEDSYAKKWADNLEYKIKNCLDYDFKEIPALEMIVWATDTDDAIKIVNNKRLQLITDKKWEVN